MPEWQTCAMNDVTVEVGPALGNRALISGAAMTLGVSNEATQTLLTKWVRTSKVGPTEDLFGSSVVAQLDADRLTERPGSGTSACGYVGEASAPRSGSQGFGHWLQVAHLDVLVGVLSHEVPDVVRVGCACLHSEVLARSQVGVCHHP